MYNGSEFALEHSVTHRALNWKSSDKEKEWICKDVNICVLMVQFRLDKQKHGWVSSQDEDTFI